jgi:uncharacterized membrane protein
MSDPAPGLSLLVACFDGKGAASAARKDLDGKIAKSGGAILDEAILRVNEKGKALVHDPRRTMAGALTPALTWGLFGALSGGGLSGLITWAIIGAVCGGLAGYYLEHSLTKSEMLRVGRRLPNDSSAILAFVRTSEASAILGLTSAYGPSAASIAAIGKPLSARIWTGAATPTEAAPASSATQSSDPSTLVSMAIVRSKGEHGIREINARIAKDKAIVPELLFEVDKQGKKRVSAPVTGVGATAKSSAPGWAGLGLIFGLIVGWAGGGGILSALPDGLVTAIAWGIFGLGAGSLYGLWAGRAISARRLRGLTPLLSPDTSAMIAWVDGAITEDTKGELSTSESESVVVGFDSVEHGVILKAI